MKNMFTLLLTMAAFVVCGQTTGQGFTPSIGASGSGIVDSTRLDTTGGISVLKYWRNGVVTGQDTLSSAGGSGLTDAQIRAITSDSTEAERDARIAADLLPQNLVFSNTAPANLLVKWVDNTNVVYGHWPIYEFVEGGWQQYGYYNQLANMILFTEAYDILFTGQSNALGGAGSDGGERLIELLAQAWNGSQWVISNLNNAPYRGSEFSNAAHHLAIARARYSVMIGKPQVQRVVLSAETGRPISDWILPSGVRYLDIQAQTIASGVAAAGGYDTAGMSQGERNDEDSFLTYENQVDTFIDQLRAETWWSDNTHIYFIAPHDGKFARESAKMASSHRRFANDGNPNTHVILTGKKDIHSDNIHSTAKGLKEVALEWQGSLLGKEIEYYQAPVVYSGDINFAFASTGSYQTSERDVSIVNPRVGAAYDLTFYKDAIITTDSDLTSSSGHSINPKRLPAGQYTFTHIQGNVFVVSEVTGRLEEPIVIQDTSAVSFDNTFQFEAATGTNNWTAPTGTGSFDSYAISENSIPEGQDFELSMDVSGAANTNIFMAVQPDTALHKWNEQGGYERGLYYQESSSLPRIIVDGALNNLPFLNLAVVDKFRLQRVSGELTLDYFNGSTWIERHNFGVYNEKVWPVFSILDDTKILLNPTLIINGAVEPLSFTKFPAKNFQTVGDTLVSLVDYTYENQALANYQIDSTGTFSIALTPESENVMIAFRGDRVNDRWNGASPYTYALYYQQSGSKFRIVENGSVSDAQNSYGAITYTGTESIRLRRSVDTVFGEFFDGTNWVEIQEFTTKTSETMYLALSAATSGSKITDYACTGCSYSQPVQVSSFLSDSITVLREDVSALQDNQPSILTTTATLDYPGIPSMADEDLTITIPGAVLGDVVALGVPNSAVSSDLTYFAWVSAANTVTVRITNSSASIADPSSGAFTVKILK